MNPPSADLIQLVHNRNEFNKIANALTVIAINVFTPLVGTKIKAMTQGGFTNKIQSLVESAGLVKYQSTVTSHFSFQYQTLYLVVKFNGINHDVRIGNIDSEGKLKDCIGFDRLLKTDYNAEHISHTNQRIAELEEQIRLLRNSCAQGYFREGIV